MRIVAVLSVIIIFSGCNPVLVSLKGKYNDRAVEITTNKSSDAVWMELLTLFSKNGLSIKNVDKQEGTIRTTKVSSSSMYTLEDDNGQPENAQAWVVLARVFNKNREWKPKDIYGQWSIDVTEKEKGTATIKIDPVVICTYFPNSFTKMEQRGQSTGQLEKLIEQSMRSN